MFDFMMNNPFKKGMDKARFQGSMHCPHCSRQADPTSTPIGFETNKTKIILKETVGPFIRVYKCGSCNGEWRYDINQHKKHPYSSFKRGLKLPGLKFSGRVPTIGARK